MGRIDIYIHQAPRRVVRDESEYSTWFKKVEQKFPGGLSRNGNFIMRGNKKIAEWRGSAGESVISQPSGKDNLIGGNHRPEGVHAKDTPIVADDKPGILDGILKINDAMGKEQFIGAVTRECRYLKRDHKKSEQEIRAKIEQMLSDGSISTGSALTTAAKSVMREIS